MQKKWRWLTWDPSIANSTNGTARCSQRCCFSVDLQISANCTGLIFWKKVSFIKSKLFHRFYKFDHLIATNGTLENILSYVFDLITPVSTVLSYFCKKRKYAVPPLSAIDLQTWLSVHLLVNTSALCSIAWVFPQFKTNRSITKATGTEVLLYGVLYKIRSRYISQENLVSSEHMEKNLVTVLIFSVAGLFYIVIFGLKLMLC